jgi:hypothetical protein
MTERVHKLSERVNKFAKHVYGLAEKVFPLRDAPKGPNLSAFVLQADDSFT